jgi:hypothetical protein
MDESRGACGADRLDRDTSAGSWRIEPIGARSLRPAWGWLAELMDSLVSTGVYMRARFDCWLGHLVTLDDT